MKLTRMNSLELNEQNYSAPLSLAPLLFVVKFLLLAIVSW